MTPLQGLPQLCVCACKNNAQTKACVHYCMVSRPHLSKFIEDLCEVCYNPSRLSVTDGLALKSDSYFHPKSVLYTVVTADSQTFCNFCLKPFNIQYNKCISSLICLFLIFYLFMNLTFNLFTTNPPFPQKQQGN